MTPAPYTTDTSPEALAVQLECLRRMTPQQRLRKTCAISRRVKKMAFDAIRRLHLDLDANEVRLRFVELTHGKMLAEEIARWDRGAIEVSESEDLIDALAPVVAALRASGIPHYVGGSVASSFHGAARSTMDVDLVCELHEDQVAAFITALGSDFYISESAVREAVRRRSCCNLIHMPTSFKVDLFVSRGRPFDLESMRRASLQRLGETRTVEVRIASAEDSIISKLEWYRLTDETSQRQWDDVAKLVMLLGKSADLDYLRRAAASVGVTDLLAKQLKQ